MTAPVPMRAKWTPEMQARLCELRAAGKTNRQIATLMGLSWQQVYDRARILPPPAPAARAPSATQRLGIRITRRGGISLPHIGALDTPAGGENRPAGA